MTQSPFVESGRDMRKRLTEAAAHLVATEGAASLSTRRVASAAGTSSMSVYSAFGSMGALVLAVIEEGFEGLAGSLSMLCPSADPVADLAAQTTTFVHHVEQNPELYGVLSGVVPLGAYSTGSPSQLAAKHTATRDAIEATMQRAIDAKRIRADNPRAIAMRWWTLVHGYILLRAGGYVDPDRSTERILIPLLRGFLLGEGDDPERVDSSILRGLTAAPTPRS